jgi:hypothetical protein
VRTTLNIDDALLAEAKRRAGTEGVSLGVVVDDALRRRFTDRPDRGIRPKIPVFRGGRGPRPGVDLSSNRAVRELLDDGVELDKLR